jgi:pyruvate kinase
LLPLDREYVEEALALGVRKFMLSFVEEKEDVAELEEAIEELSNGRVSAAECELVFKIESAAGVAFVKSLNARNFSDDSPYRLMAARDDLMIQIGVLGMSSALAAIAAVDARAICASRLLLGVEKGGVSMADLADLEYMRSLGFRSFMLSDEVSREHFTEAVAFMEEYLEVRPLTAT